MRILATITLALLIAAPTFAEITTPGNLLERACNDSGVVFPTVEKIPVHFLTAAWSEVYYEAITAQAVKNYFLMEHCVDPPDVACSSDTDCPGSECDKSEAAEFDVISTWITESNALEDARRMIRLSNILLLCDDPDAPDEYADGADVRLRLGIY